MKVLFLLFLIIPIIEIYLLIQVGSVIGAFYTILLIILTAIAGAFLLRIQGLATLRRVQEAVAMGKVPAMELLEGLMLLVGGALLLTPGFFTDALGFICLIPTLRQGIIRLFLFQKISRMQSQNYQKKTEQQQSHSSNIIEGEFYRENDKNNKTGQ
ncbi:MAG TPA: membrane protein FxsA [Gammaproteobacteria bacterium]|nr:membrane protein FxsA [Gammaproteobacteria bacterium]